jgi:hypothetical protein
MPQAFHGAKVIVKASACILSKWDIASSIAMPYQAGSSAQRIRIGLTGLAFAFLLVLLGSIISRSSGDGRVTNAAQQAATNEPSEPLAELGVAPGASDSNTNNASTKK